MIPYGTRVPLAVRLVAKCYTPYLYLYLYFLLVKNRSMHADGGIGTCLVVVCTSTGASVSTLRWPLNVQYEQLTTS